RRGPARAGVGRARRSVHQHRARHAQQPAPQAGRPAGDRDGDRGRLRDPVSPLLRFSIRTRLALTYGGVFFAMGLALMAVSYLIADPSLRPSEPTGRVVRYTGAPVPPGVLPNPPLPGQRAQQIQLVVSGSPGGPALADGPVAIGLQGLLTDFRVQTL